MSEAVAEIGAKTRELADEVRAVARKIHRSRRILSVPLLLAKGCGQLGLLTADPSCLDALFFLAVAAFVSILLSVPYLVALPIIALYRHRYQLRLCRLITQIPDDQRKEVLDALFSEGHETAAIVAPALRRLDLPYEMVPATPPGGRGNEVSAG